jgi:hypothetical protein
MFKLNGGTLKTGVRLHDRMPAFREVMSPPGAGFLKLLPQIAESRWNDCWGSDRDMYVLPPTLSVFHR